jgi:hypothetical protein
MHPALVILSFLCACALFALVPIHRARISLPIGALVFWLIAANVVHGVDAILWVTPSTPKLFAWCDVCESSVVKTALPETDISLLLAIRLSMAATLAIPTSSLCILHRLSFQALPRSTSRPFITARCIILFDLTLCLVCPLLYVAFCEHNLLFLTGIALIHRFRLACTTASLHHRRGHRLSAFCFRHIPYSFRHAGRASRPLSVYHGLLRYGALIACALCN